MTDRVHVPQVAAAVPERIRLQQRERCIMCTSNIAALQQALSTCAYSSMASKRFLMIGLRHCIGKLSAIAAAKMPLSAPLCSFSSKGHSAARASRDKYIGLMLAMVGNTMSAPLNCGEDDTDVSHSRHTA